MTDHAQPSNQMQKPTLFGTARSRAVRALWGMEEVGTAYTHVPLGFGAEAKAADYLAVNPNGRIPALVDGDLRLFESMAINLYLAKRYGGTLYPADAAGEALAWQWSVWAISEIEPLQMRIVIDQLFTAPEKRNPRSVESAIRGLQRPLQVLNTALAQRSWLVGEQFSVADLNVAAVMLLLSRVNVGYEAHPHVQRWATACHARPALARAQALP